MGASDLVTGGPLSFWQTYGLGAMVVWAAMMLPWTFTSERRPHEDR